MQFNKRIKKKKPFGDTERLFSGMGRNGQIKIFSPYLFDMIWNRRHFCDWKKTDEWITFEKSTMMNGYKGLGMDLKIGNCLIAYCHTDTSNSIALSKTDTLLLFPRVQKQDLLILRSLDKEIIKIIGFNDIVSYRIALIDTTKQIEVADDSYNLVTLKLMIKGEIAPFALLDFTLYNEMTGNLFLNRSISKNTRMSLLKELKIFVAAIGENKSSSEI